jgi:hypothetical protein
MKYKAICETETYIHKKGDQIIILSDPFLYQYEPTDVLELNVLYAEYSKKYIRRERMIISTMKLDELENNFLYID